MNRPEMLTALKQAQGFIGDRAKMAGVGDGNMLLLSWFKALELAIHELSVDAVPVVQQWINTKDRLPADRGRYLVMIKTDGKIGFEVHEHLIRILYFGSEGWRLPRHFPEWIHEALKQEVTHWMPLPEPPKMDDDA